MTSASDIENAIDTVLGISWDSRKGTTVPKTEDITLKNGAVELEATYVYADLADSSALGQKLKKAVAAKIVRSYLDAATRIIRNYDGHIRSFDGDRVMGIFIGESKNSNATRAALAINWAVSEVLKPKFQATWPTLKDYWTPAHGIGIDTGEALLVRGGVRDNNDLVSIGSAPNVAAKLSELRCHPIHVTDVVYDRTNHKNSPSTGKPMWSGHPDLIVADHTHEISCSTWWWSL